jgi:hypothetical protein
MAGLFLLSASTLLLEVQLTKVFANKLDYHFTFAIIAMAMLGFGAAGVFVQLRADVFTREPSAVASSLSRYALGYTAALLLGIAAFVVLPLDPYAPDWTGYAALPVYFLLFAGIFFLAGVCVSALFMVPGTSPAQVYFWDLLGAAAGAALGPLLLSRLGAYGSAVIAASFSLGATLLLLSQAQSAPSRPRLGYAISIVVFLSCAAIALGVPRQRLALGGLEIKAFKSIFLRDEFLSQFKGASQSYWNPIARIDVSKTGTSPFQFRWGMPRRTAGYPIEGRMILVDGAAFTRQYALKGTPEETDILKNVLFAAPYVMKQDAKRTLLLGPGGGIDILIAKLYQVREVTALELNPDTYRLLLGRPEDRERARYVQSLRSDSHTRVTIHNVEGRHYVHAHAGQEGYDVVLATGVDTLTAIGALGNSLNENFLYTRDAITDYMSLLRRGGILALTHWERPLALPLRLFNTYLDVLDKAGVRDAGKRVVVASDGQWDDVFLKKDADFTAEEIARLRGFTAYNNYRVIYDPFLAQDAPSVMPEDPSFGFLARASTSDRLKILASLPFDVSPATDERPYFYWIRNNSESALESATGSYLFPVPSIRVMFLVTVFLCLVLAAIPAWVLKKRKIAVASSLRALPFFALAGFGFILAENALFMRLTLFVGGPFYSLSIVLPAILIGYSLGSFLAGRFVPRAVKGGVLLLPAYAAGFLLFGWAASHLLPAFMSAGLSVRMAIATCLVAPFGILLGLAVPWYMETLKADERAGETLAWMWGVNSAGNVIGSMLFVPLCHALGMHNAFNLAGLFYLVAVAWGTAALRRSAA